MWVRLPPALYKTAASCGGYLFPAYATIISMDILDPRLVFMGSPNFALPILQTLHAHFSVVGVVTQPDRPAGRGRKLTPPPVKSWTTEHNLPVIQPHRPHLPEAIEHIQRWNPDLIVVAAYGQILKPILLELPPHGCLNVHASLLPRWRGASPVQHAILHGDEQTGVTIMLMEAGMDTGPILSQKAIPIQPEETAGSLSDRLARLGADLLVQTIPPYLRGEITPQPQDETQATYAPMLKKADGELDFFQPAERLARKVRAFHPWPGTFFYWQDRRLRVLRAHAVPEVDSKPGQIEIHAGLPAIGTSQGMLVIDEIQPAGKKSMTGKAFLAGAPQWKTR